MDQERQVCQALLEESSQSNRGLALSDKEGKVHSSEWRIFKLLFGSIKYIYISARRKCDILSVVVLKKTRTGRKLKKRTKRIEENPAILPNPLNNNLLRLYSGGVAI